MFSESEKCKNHVDKLGACREDIVIIRRNQLCAEEKLRRQTEMLEECQGKLDISLQMNNALVIKQAELQRWTNHLDDDEARYTMNQLCQDTETWVKRHFPEVLPRDRPDDFITDDPSARSNGDFGLFCATCDYISCNIFEKYLTRTMVGFINPGANKDLSIIEKQIHLICPAHVTQHWRSAMSTATFSMSREDLISDCRAHVAAINDWLHRSPSTDLERRREQLGDIVWKFVNFKSKLDAQADRYLFIWAREDTPFCEETMTDFLGESDVDAVVRYCFAPTFFRVLSDTEKVLVRKAVVITSVSGTDEKW
ncbi:hypothetical protein N7490_009691 [Penicillium lividum]|nr:hypothetical protein N7490_009691 [Penicillium lividum]